MDSLKNDHGQAGYSLIELLLAMSFMVVIMGVVFTFARDSMRTNVVTMEMTEAQESVRSAHEMLNRDLISAGDGLNGINNISLPRLFVTSYLAVNPVLDPSNNNMVQLCVVTSDNDVPANTPVLLTNPAVTVRSNPVRTDRLTIMEADPNFTPIALPANAWTPSGANLSVSPADIGRFNIGDIYFITSAAGATFGAVTNVNNGDDVIFANSDTLGINAPGDGGPINVVTNAGTMPSSMTRMLMIHYFVDSNGLLIRRVFGSPGAGGFRDSVIAEHVVDLQFRFGLNLFNGNGTIMQPVAQLANATQQVAVRQVEVTLTVETTHPVLNGTRPRVTMTSTTSVRNMQFRQSLQPGTGG